MLFLLALTFLSFCQSAFGYYGNVSSKPTARDPDLSTFLIVEDFEKYAERNMQKQSLAYVQSGSMLEQTLKENTEAFRRLRLQHKIMRDTSNKDIRTTILGHQVSIPIAVCPNALQRILTSDGEKATARAVLAENTLMILSTYSSFSMEEVAASSPSVNRWFQLDFLKNRNITEDLLRRAKASNYSAIVITADAPVLSFRIRYMRLKFNFADHRTGNLEKYTKLYSEEDLEDAPITWSDIQWVKSISGLPVIVKGVLTAEEGLLAVQHGADAVIVSTHGGRQLDGVPASIEALPDVVKAVNDNVEVYLDSGVRLGSDVVKALALGARAVFIGRANLYGLFAGGQKGSRRVLQLLTNELKNVMDLIGAANISELNHSYIKREEYYRQTLD